jgi:hypothetical protein
VLQGIVSSRSIGKTILPEEELEPKNAKRGRISDKKNRNL